MNIEKNGYLIEDYLTKKTMSIGSPGVQIFKIQMTNGDLKPIANNPNQHELRINYDCPFLFPLNDNHKGKFDFKDREIIYFHKIKKRGQQEFSTLDILRLPKFSAIQIVVPILEKDYNIKDNGLIESKLDDLSWDLINFLNRKINDVIDLKEFKIDLDANKILSYRNLYFDKSDYTQVNAFTVFPYTSMIHINAPKNTENIDEDILRLYLQNRIELKNYVEEYLPKVQKEQDFEKIVFRIVHDFAHYSSERPESLFQLNEELIRDLFLIALKVLLPYSDAEVFNYDGKLDFKVSNPINQYEIITGEYKVWSGKDSFDECLNQITEKHSTGAEKEVYMLFINRNKKADETYRKALDMLKKDSHYLKEIDSNISLSRNQFFSKHKVKIKEKEIDLILGLINVYYSRK